MASPAPLYVHRPVINAAELISWAREQGFKNPMPAEKWHVTQVYSRKPLDWHAAGDSFDRVRASGGERTVARLGKDGAVVLHFGNADLRRRWREFKVAGASWDYDDYRPHVTITYEPGDVDMSKVKPYTGPIEFGPEVFESLKEKPMTKSAGPVLLLAKAHVKAHARRLPSGQVVQVAAHTDRRHTTLAPGQLALFTRHGEPMKPNPYKGKDPVKDTPDLFEHIDPPRAASPAAPPPAPEPAPTEPVKPAKPHPLERSRATMAEYQKDHDDAVASGDTGTAEFMQHLLGTHREGHEALEAAFGHFDKHGDGLELSHKDGRRHVIFLPDASNPGKYRYQMFDARGMMSHSTHDSPEEAVADAASSGYTVHNPGVLDKLASTEEWEEGMAINALIQAHGSGQFGYPEFVKRVKAVQEEFKARRAAREPAMAKALDFGTVEPTVLSFKSTLLAGLVPQC